jgi:murein DD-endopeptidase MepM/ murein hydrolase activator NlpD
MRLARLCAIALLASSGIVATPNVAMAAPLYRVPFHCNQNWAGETRTNHSPLNAIDFNRPNDLGDAVLASAPGTVSQISTASGYGRYLRINHGGGHATLYAHLSAVNVSVGESVGYNRVVGRVGETGQVTGPHLHYEQISGGSVVRARFNNNPALYFGTQNYVRLVGC